MFLLVSDSEELLPSLNLKGGEKEVVLEPRKTKVG